MSLKVFGGGFGLTLTFPHPANNGMLVLVALVLGHGVLAIHNITIDDTDQSIVYSGDWVPDSELNDSLAYGGSYRNSSDSNATAIWQFTGQSTPRAPYTHAVPNIDILTLQAWHFTISLRSGHTQSTRVLT
jgi:hypothetical protein